MDEQHPSKSTKQELSSLEYGSWAGFLEVQARLIPQLDAELQAAHGLSISSYEVLLFLAKTPGMQARMSDLARQAVLSQSGLTRLIDRLIHEGLVTRKKSSDDLRGQYAVLTHQGLMRLRAANATHLAGVRRLFLAHCEEKDLVMLDTLWKRILTALQAPAAPSEHSAEGE